MRRATTLLFPIVLSFACSLASAQELTLTVEFVIFDCTDHVALFDQYMDHDAENRALKQEALATIRKEAPVRDSMKCRQLLKVDQQAVHVSQSTYQEMRFIATARPHTEEGTYMLELRMACSLPPQGGSGLSGAGSGYHGPIPLNETKVTSIAASGNGNAVGQARRAQLGLCLVTLSEGNPQNEAGGDFFDIRPRVWPRPRQHKAVEQQAQNSVLSSEHEVGG